MEIWVDGSTSKYSSAYCIYYKRRKKNKILKVLDKMIPLKIELTAIFEALKTCPNTSNIYTDSRTSYNYSMFDITPREEVKELVIEIRKLLNEKKSVITWIPRERNLAGHWLERRLEKLKNYSRGSIW